MYALVMKFSEQFYNIHHVLNKRHNFANIEQTFPSM